MSLNDVTVAVPYQTGGSILNVKGMSLILPSLNIIPNQITVYQASTFGTRAQVSGVYTITRATGSVIAGLSLVSGTDGPWAVGDLVELQITAPTGIGTGSVTQVNTAGLVGGGPIGTTGTIALVNGTANTLIGYGASGVPQGISVTGSATLASGVLNVTSSALPGGTAGQIQVNSAGTAFAGVTASGDGTISATGVISITKTAGVPFAASATIDTTNAANISSGFIPLARIPIMVASGPLHAPGAVGDPGSTPGATRYWREDASWGTPPTGSGTVNAGTINQFAGYTATGTAVSGVNASVIATALNLSGTNTGDQTITLTGPVTGSGTGSFATTIGSSIALPGSPTTTTQAGSDSSTKLATTAFVAAATTISASNISTGTLPAGQLPVVGLTITQHQGTIITVTESTGTATVNWALGDSQTVTLNANVTIAFSAPVVGQSILLSIVQAASGGPYTISAWPSGITWVAATGPPVASVNAGNALLVKIYCVSSGVYFGWNLGITGEAPSSGTIAEIAQTASFSAVAGTFYAISGSSAVTATLPTAVGVTGQTIRIRCVSGYTGLCTITGTSGQTIGGQTSRIIFAGESPLLQSDGANWIRTGGIVIQSYCVMNNSVFQSPVYNTPTTVNFDTIVKDNTGVMANITNHTIAAIRPGRYRFWSIVSFGISGGPTLAFSLYIAAVKNSTNEFFDDNTYYMNNLFSSMTVSEKCGGIISLAAADTMKLQWNETNSGGSTPYATVNGLGSTGGAPFTQMELEEIVDW